MMDACACGLFYHMKKNKSYCLLPNSLFHFVNMQQQQQQKATGNKKRKRTRDDPPVFTLTTTDEIRGACLRLYELKNSINAAEEAIKPLKEQVADLNDSILKMLVSTPEYGDHIEISADKIIYLKKKTKKPAKNYDTVKKVLKQMHPNLNETQLDSTLDAFCDQGAEEIPYLELQQMVQQFEPI
jgi:vacuolar-type H+-ATPase subunit I/STV1